jgi:succinate dehydrogenase / fumarate reductase flavoprotein subunit
MPLPNGSVRRARAEWEQLFGSSPSAPPLDVVGPLRKKLTELMTTRVGIFREAEDLERAVEEISQLRNDFTEIQPEFAKEPFNYAVFDYLELGYLLELSQIVAAGALKRTESRGAHSRLDFPDRDDERWLAHTFAEKRDGETSFRLHSVKITQHSPQERGY